jgi:hypothetical protein
VISHRKQGGEPTHLILVIGSGLVAGEAKRLGLRPLSKARTAPRFRLLSIEDRWAAIVRADEGGIAVDGLLCEVPAELWEPLVAGEPAGVTQEPVELADGRKGVTAAFADARAQADADDISSYGGFLAYLAVRDRVE